MTLYNHQHGKALRLLPACLMVVFVLLVSYTATSKGCRVGKGKYVKEEYCHNKTWVTLANKKKKFTCDKWEENSHEYMVLTSGACDQRIKSHEDCDAAAHDLHKQLNLNGQNGDKEWREDQQTNDNVASIEKGGAPVGCHSHPQDRNLQFKDKHTSTTNKEMKCGEILNYNCICKKDTCNPCPDGTFSLEGNEACRKCPVHIPHSKKKPLNQSKDDLERLNNKKNRIIKILLHRIKNITTFYSTDDERNKIREQLKKQSPLAWAAASNNPKFVKGLIDTKIQKKINDEIFPINDEINKMFCSADLYCDKGWGYKYILKTSGFCEIPLSKEECKAVPHQHTIDFQTMAQDGRFFTDGKLKKVPGKNIPLENDLDGKLISREEFINYGNFERDQYGRFNNGPARDYTGVVYGDKKKKPNGCYIHHNRYYFNDLTPSENINRACSPTKICICKQTRQCIKCPAMEYSKGGKNTPCVKCSPPAYVAEDNSQCYDPLLKADIAHLKEIQNEIEPKTTYLWQQDQTRLEYDRRQNERKGATTEKEKKSCENEKMRHTKVFPAAIIDVQVEDGQDTTCLATNRDEMLQSFCAFKIKLKSLFEFKNVLQGKNMEDFWPNICCKNRNGNGNSDKCSDSTGKVKREDIVPFALSQGGTYNRNNLMIEITRTMREDGYFHEGLINLLEKLESLKKIKKYKKKEMEKVLNEFFTTKIGNGESFCGPHIVNEPGESGRQLCELFVPYHRIMKIIYDMMAPTIVDNDEQSPSFLETIQSLLRKRGSKGNNRQGKKDTVDEVMQSKQKRQNPTKGTCNYEASGTKYPRNELEKYQEAVCPIVSKGKGALKMDLVEFSKRDIIENVAVHYLGKDSLGLNDVDTEKFFKKLRTLSINGKLRYDVDDYGCQEAPLFRAEDISIQQIPIVDKKAWVAVVKLNSKERNGYMQTELRNCHLRSYLPGAKVTVKAYKDVDSCCEGNPDYKECLKSEKCQGKGKLEKVYLEPDDGEKLQKEIQYKKTVIVTGNLYKVETSKRGQTLNMHRRQLLQQHQGTGTG